MDHDEGVGVGAEPTLTMIELVKTVITDLRRLYLIIKYRRDTL